MGFLSDLMSASTFGLVDFDEKPQRQVNKFERQIPSWLLGPMKENISNISEVFGRDFTPYGGDAIASFTGDENTAFNAMRDVFGAQTPYFNQAMTGLSTVQQNLMAPPTLQDLDPYMNPFQQGVTDIAKQRAVEDWNPEIQRIRDLAASRGAFGGSRQAILESESTSNLQDRLSEIQTMGDFNNFSNALGQYYNQQQMQQGASQNLMAGADATQNRTFGDIQGLLGTGGQQRALDQAQLDFDYQEFLRGQGWDQGQTAAMQQLLLPTAELVSPTRSDTTTYSASNPINELFGAGLSLAGLFSGNPAVALGGSTALNQSFQTPWTGQRYGYKEGGMVKEAFGCGGKVKKYAKGGLVKKYADGGPVLTPLPRKEVGFNDIQNAFTGMLDFVGDTRRSGAKFFQPGVEKVANEAAFAKDVLLGNTPVDISPLINMRKAGANVITDFFTGEPQEAPSLEQEQIAPTALPMGEGQVNNDLEAMLQQPYTGGQVAPPDVPTMQGAFNSATNVVNQASQPRSEIQKKQSFMDRVNMPLMMMGAAMMGTKGSFGEGLYNGLRAYDSKVSKDRATDLEAQKQLSEHLKRLADIEKASMELSMDYLKFPYEQAKMISETKRNDASALRDTAEANFYGKYNMSPADMARVESITQDYIGQRDKQLKDLNENIEYVGNPEAKAKAERAIRAEYQQLIDNVYKRFSGGAPQGSDPLAWR